MNIKYVGQNTADFLKFTFGDAVEEDSLQEQAEASPNLKGRAGHGEKGEKDKKRQNHWSSSAKYNFQ